MVRTDSAAQEPNNRIAAIDPGKSIGFAFFTGDDLELSGVYQNEHDALESLFHFLKIHDPKEIVIESFRLYPWKAKLQFWSDFETPEVIGIIKHWAWLNKYPVILQPASCKKPFPDERLKQMGYYRPNDHTRDAVRHGLYRLRFGKTKEAKS